MHMAMRKYRLLKGTHADATHWVERNLMPTLRKAPGFRAYYAVVFDDGIFGSINVFDSEAAAEDAIGMCASVSATAPPTCCSTSRPRSGRCCTRSMPDGCRARRCPLRRKH